MRIIFNNYYHNYNQPQFLNWSWEWFVLSGENWLLSKAFHKYEPRIFFRMLFLADIDGFTPGSLSVGPTVVVIIYSIELI